MPLFLEGGNISQSNFSIKTHKSKAKLKCFHSGSAREAMTWFNYPSLRFEANDYTTNNLTTANTTNKFIGLELQKDVKNRWRQREAGSSKPEDNE